MISAIFQPEVSTLESQVAALQAQIAAHTERISLLNETELLAGGSLESLKTAIEKVSALAPDAIANLRAAVLNLFSGGDDSNDGGNQPIPLAPNPQPGFDNRTLHELALDACREYAQEQEVIAPQPELTGQSCEWASLLASPLASPHTSWLCCQLEDAPNSALTGQSVEIANFALVSDAPQQEPYVELIPVTHLVAYQRRRVDGEIICCYLAGNNKNRLKDWGSWLCNQHSVGSGFELRLALRMTAYKWELKIWGMSFKQIQRLAETDTTKTPPSRYHVASFPVAANLLQTDEVSAPQEAVAESSEVKPDSLMLQVGDKVQVISDRHGAELVGQSGIVTAGTATGAAVDVGGTLRWFCADELAAVSTPVSAASLEPTEAEKVAIASIQPPAYNPNPMGRAGAVANWKARQAAGIGVDLKNCGTGGIKTMAEWQQIEAEQKAEKALAATASTPDDEPDF